jgi:glycosyltransferase involved in cell wall biosynthesis
VTPLISVIICTHNRAAYLEQSITSVLVQSADADLELIVVDNCSTDATASVVERVAASAPVQYVHEPALGLSRARNTGRRLARGRYIAYLDDDAIAMPGWVRAIPRAFAVTSGVAVVGGRVDPVWEATRPGWLSDDLAMGLAIVNWSDEPRLLRDINREWLVGANIAFDAGLLDELGGFDGALGRSGRRLLSGEEIVLQHRAVARGYACVYYPQMYAHHVISASRMHKGWFRRRYFWQGVSDAVMELADARPALFDRVKLGAAAAGRVLGDKQKLQDLLTDSNDPGEFTRRAFLLIEVGRAAGLLGLARRAS